MIYAGLYSEPRSLGFAGSLDLGAGTRGNGKNNDDNRYNNNGNARILSTSLSGITSRLHTRRSRRFRVLAGSR